MGQKELAEKERLLSEAEISHSQPGSDRDRIKLSKMNHPGG